jgi:hypothetical protein
MQTIRKPLAFITTAFLIFILIFYSSCQKETSVDSEQTIAAAGSSIIYTNVNPDSTIISEIHFGVSGDSSKDYYLDLNNDKKADFVFRIYYQSFSRCLQGGFNSFVSVSPANGSSNQIANVNLYAAALDSLTSINASLSKWSGVTAQKLGEYDRQCDICDVRSGCYGSPAGNWTTGSIKYLGLKIISSNNVYYGWARLMIAIGPWSKLTIMDYAYNSNPNQPILAGQTK